MDIRDISTEQLRKELIRRQEDEFAKSQEKTYQHRQPVDRGIRILEVDVKYSKEAEKTDYGRFLVGYVIIDYSYKNKAARHHAKVYARSRFNLTLLLAEKKLTMLRQIRTHCQELEDV